MPCTRAGTPRRPPPPTDVSVLVAAAIRACVLVFATIVLAISAYFTVTYDYLAEEIAYRTTEMPWVLLGTICVIAIVCLPRYECIMKQMGTKRLMRATFAISLVIGIAWLFASDVYQQWDSGDVLSNARIGTQLEAGDIYGLGTGGYVARFPYQAPMILLARVLILVAGTRADLAFCLLNALAVAVTMYAIVGIGAVYSQVTGMRRVPYVTAVFALSFFPAYGFVCFVYGNTISLMLVALAFLCMARSMLAEERDTFVPDVAADEATLRRHMAYYRYGLMSGILLALAYVAKSSSSVALIAAAMAWCVWAMRRRRVVVPILAVILSFALGTIAMGACTSGLSRLAGGTNFSDGEGALSWVVMGTGAYQPEDEPIATEHTPIPGTFDGYIWNVLKDDEYSSEGYAKDSRERLAARFRRMADEPGEALRFFVKKVVYEWGDPLYESLLASNWARGNIYVLGHGPVEGTSQADVPSTPIAESVYYGRANFVIRWGSDVLQTVTFLGFLVGCTATFGGRGRDRWVLMMAPALYAAGGGLLYILWEAKSQYIFGFAMMMIPMAAYGLSWMSDAVRRRFVGGNAACRLQ